MIRSQMQSTSIKDNIRTWISQLKKQYEVLDTIDCDLYTPDSIDLFNKIKTNYKAEYSSNQRIILTFTKDYYKKYHPAIMFQSIQTMLNEIDISNSFVCIVSTNPDLQNISKWIAKNISSDPIPVHVYQAQGKFTNISTTKNAYQKFSSIRHGSDIVDSMPDRIKHLLLDSKTFCILPWISQYTTQDNMVKPCCHFSMHEALGNAKKDTLKQIWNNKNTKQLRLDMLAEKPIDACKVCYSKNQDYNDTTVFRVGYNRNFAHHYKKIVETNTDGSLDSFKLNHITYKPNNLCNLQCRMCNIYDSSSFYLVEKAIGNKVVGKALKQSNPNLFDQYAEHVDNIEQVVFEGGEPLMMKETYDFVKMLDKNKRHNIHLQYITNMTHAGLGKDDVFKLWKNFNEITIYASLDAENDRGLYLRPGSYKWQQIVDFRKEMLKQRPDIFFNVQSTLSLLNALHMPDFHKSWVKQGLVRPEHWIVNTLTNRKYLRVTTAPKFYKDKIRTKLEKHLEWLRPLDPYGKSTSGYLSVLHALEVDEPFDKHLFWQQINKRDTHHGVNLYDCFPELVDLPQ